MHEKQTKQQDLLTKARNLSKAREHRAQTCQLNKEKKIQRLKTLQKERLLQHENEILRINDKLDAFKREKELERIKYAEQIEHAKHLQKQWSRQTKTIQKLRWKNYSQGLERSIRDKQNRTKSEYEIQFESKQKQNAQRQLNRTRLLNQIKTARNSYDQTLSNSKQITLKVTEQNLQTKRIQVEGIQKAKDVARSKYLHAKPFEKKLEQTRLLKSKNRTKITLKKDVTDVTAADDMNVNDTQQSDNTENAQQDSLKDDLSKT